MVTVEQIESLAARAAWRYKNRCWWADVDDLKQYAAEAVVRALRTWDPRENIPFDGYAWRAAILALSKQVKKASAPVSASDGSLGDLLGVFSAPLTALRGHLTPTPDPGELLSRAQYLDEVRRRVARLFVGLPDGHLAEPVLLRGERPRRVASQAGVPVQRVYRAAGAARRAIFMNQRLWQLWRNKE